MKRNNLLEQVSKINSRVQEIQKNSQIIENDVQVEVEGLTIRLENAEAEKVVKFQSEIKRLEHLVNIIDDIFYTFEESVKVPEKFLLLYKQIKERIVNVDIYQITNPLSGDHTQLPEEFKEMENLIHKSEQIEKESKFIDEVLVKVLQTYPNVLREKELLIR